jgi:hypothetical protein
MNQTVDIPADAQTRRLLSALLHEHIAGAVVVLE